MYASTRGGNLNGGEREEERSRTGNRLTRFAPVAAAGSRVGLAREVSFIHRRRGGGGWVGGEIKKGTYVW